MKIYFFNDIHNHVFGYQANVIDHDLFRLIALIVALEFVKKYGGKVEKKAMCAYIMLCI